MTEKTGKSDREVEICILAVERQTGYDFDDNIYTSKQVIDTISSWETVPYEEYRELVNAIKYLTARDISDMGFNNCVLEVLVRVPERKLIFDKHKEIIKKKAEENKKKQKYREEKLKQDAAKKKERDLKKKKKLLESLKKEFGEV